MTALTEIEKLVDKVAKEALQDDLALHEKVEALKVLTPYYQALKKDTKSEDTETSTMDDFAKAMKEPNAAQVRSHRGRQ